MRTPKTPKVSGFHICDILDLKKDESLAKNSDSKNLDLSSENSNDDITVKSESPVPESSPEKPSSNVFKHSLFSDTFIHYQHLLQNPAVRPWLYMNHNGEFSYTTNNQSRFLKQKIPSFK